MIMMIIKTIIMVIEKLPLITFIAEFYAGSEVSPNISNSNQTLPKMIKIQQWRWLCVQSNELQRLSTTYLRIKKTFATSELAYKDSVIR